MCKSRFIAFFLVVLFISIAACKKTDHPPSTTCSILSFTFTGDDNPSLKNKKVTYTNTKDSMLITVPENTTLNGLIPTIVHNGIGMSPATKVKQDFTKPVYYTVIAEDGSQKKYVVIVRIASGEKAILSFVFRAADNPGLTGDITGVIENDTINLSLPVGTNTDALVPSIEYNGANLSPASGQTADFGIPVTYTVTAEDGSTKSYIVMASQNATIYAASYDSFVYALDAATGRIKWKFRTDSPIRATPILYDSHLFIGSRDGNLYNLDPQTGQLNWKFVTHNPIQSDPVFYKGHVVFTSQAGVAFPGSIFSLNATTGALVWQTALPEAVYPTIGGDIVYCASSGWSSFAFDAATGVEIWRFFQDVTNAVTCVGDGVVYTGGGFAFDCLDAFTGVSLWHKNLDSYFASPTIEKGVLYANLDGEIFAMNPPTGQVYWTYSETHYPSPLGPPTVYNGTVYTSSKNGVLHAINATTGIKKWTFGTYGERTLFYNNVTAANGVVYAGAADSSIVALNEKSGALIWKKKTGGPVWAGVLAVDGRNELYLPGISGNKQ